MRGSNQRSGELFSYVDLEKRVRLDHPLRAIRVLTDSALEALSGRFCGALFRAGSAVDRARDAAAGDAVAGVLLGSLGASADGAVGVRSAVPLVRRARYGRSGVGSLDLFEEPRPAAGRRDRSQVSQRGAGSAPGQTVAVERSLLGGWHVDRGVGIDEELQAQ